jgi:type IV fimbrial biogenesis protein FimT
MPIAGRQDGASLLELMFSLSLLCLITGMAAPGFTAALRAGAVRSATFELLAGLQQVRAHAILEGRAGRLCPSGPAGTCLASSVAASSWRAELRADPGWQEFSRQSLPPGIEIYASRSPLLFWPDAMAASTGTLTICDTRGIATPRAIVINQLGRTRVTGAPPSACVA